jgi:glucose dehydrogenase
MSSRSEADVVVIGSGISGTLVARELTAAGRRVTLIERGAYVPWEEQIENASDEGPPIYEGDAPTAVHNDENAADGVDWRWEYVYAVGGTCNHWVGVSPRFLPEDFEMRSRYGVFVDWPLTYEELEPDYARAEGLLGVTGGPSPLWPGARPPLAPHPASPQDRLLEPHMRPFVRLWQARPSRAFRGRPQCCASSRCELCPVNSKFSVLNGLGDVLERPGLELRAETIAARLVASPDGGRIQHVECVDAKGERSEVHARDYVIAANAIESAGLLLRSGVTTPATGRYFSSREAQALTVSTRQPMEPGHGASKSTGASYAYYSGPFRRERSAALLAVENPGRAEIMVEPVTSGLAAGTSGSELRREAVERWRRTATFSVVVEDAPRPSNAVTLSPVKDSFGIPLNRVRYNPGPYEAATFRHLVEDAPRRLRALGATDARLFSGPTGAHLLGTLRIGDSRTGVVDADLRHHGTENLFVAGGAVFPTYSATHPTLTIAALAIRLGRTLADG